MRCLSVVIPCYNEADTIAELLVRVLASPYVAEVIVVDDASVDDSAARARAVGDDRVRVLVQPVNAGKGAAIRRGFAEAAAEFVVIQDADLEYDPVEYERLVRPLIEDRADVVFGSRFLTGDAHRVLYYWHSVGNRLLTVLSNMATNLNLTDMETCYKVFRRSVLDSFELEQDRFGIEPELTAKVAKTGCRVYEVGISYSGRTYDEGKKIGWRDGFDALRCIARYSPIGERVRRGRRPVAAAPGAAFDDAPSRGAPPAARDRSGPRPVLSTRVDGSGRAGRPDPAAGDARPGRAVSVLAATVIALVAAAGIAVRLWYLAHDPITSDEAISGLMADRILHGHFYVFYWGQRYGGVEPYAVAVMFALFGHHGVLIELTATLLSVVAGLVTWRVARRLVADRRIAALAATLSWAAPMVYVRDSNVEYGFRGVTLVAGMAALLFALRLLDHAGRRVRVALADAAGLGLAAGIGWWASPEIVYFLVPAGLLLVGAFLAGHRRTAARLTEWLPRLAAMVVAFVVGALPWLYDNVSSGFASLDSSAYLAHPPLDYDQRLHVFFHQAGPIELNLQLVETGARLVGGPGTSGLEQRAMDGLEVLVWTVVVAALLLCLLRRGRAVAIAVAVVAFPFLYAYSPATWYWRDGRYVTYVGPLLALALAVAVEEGVGRLRRATDRRAVPSRHARRPPRRSVAAGVMAGLVLLAGLASVEAYRRTYHTGTSTFAARWTDPDRRVDRAVDRLEASGIRRGYADYWVAYTSDFLGDGRVAFTPIVGDLVRSPSIAAAAGRGTGQAWLFEAPWQGPDGIGEPAFLAGLRHRHVPYRVVRAGPVTAVVPTVPLTPVQGLAAAGPAGA